jgi:hypothetical protein
MSESTKELKKMSSAKIIGPLNIHKLQEIVHKSSWMPSSNINSYKPQKYIVNVAAKGSHASTAKGIKKRHSKRKHTKKNNQKGSKKSRTQRRHRHRSRHRHTR